MQVIERLSRFYQSFDERALDAIADIYAPDVMFADPVNTLQGLDAVTAYFSEMVNGLDSCRCDITHKLQDGDEVMLRWVMTFRHARLRRGAPITLHGMSHLKVNGDKISYHQDFYDMGEMIYEHIPLLGTLVKKIKSRLETA